MQSSAAQAYRTTFGEYASRLEALQRLIDSDTASRERIEAATLAVEEARLAYNAARDRHAKELVRASAQKAASDGPAGDDQVRRTARLLWEVAGRPEGTAECDWERAEQLVRTASASR
jgi:hypothetical protein